MKKGGAFHDYNIGKAGLSPDRYSGTKYGMDEMQDSFNLRAYPTDADGKRTKKKSVERRFGESIRGYDEQEMRQLARFGGRGDARDNRDLAGAYG